MNKTEILKWFVDICLGWLMVLVIVILTKLCLDFLSTPNIFIKEPEALTQKQTDDMCVKWWFDTNLVEAKKRICGK